METSEIKNGLATKKIKMVISLEIMCNAFNALISVLNLNSYESGLKVWVLIIFYNFHKQRRFSEFTEEVLLT